MDRPSLNTDLPTFYDRLGRHDWTYMMSDDPKVYQRGSQNEQELLAISRMSPAHTELYDAYKAHAWGKGPQPERPA